MRAFQRRGLLATCLSIVPNIVPSADAADDDRSNWVLFRDEFVTADGRVVDRENANVSHSESQGWGMLFAVAFDDQPTFERIHGWTSRTLRRPSDALHAWRFEPARSPPVSDTNNATDGDIFIAAALARAAARWHMPQYHKAAAVIVNAVLRLLVHRTGTRTVLLPGVTGFERPEGVIINPSYYALPFIAELARLAPSPHWDHVLADGVSVIERGRFGPWQLPPDWLLVRSSPMSLDPAPGWPPRFSYDAIRVPLWFVWGRRPTGDMQDALERYWTSFAPGQVPAWIDLVTNEMASYFASPGMTAVMRLTLAAMHATPPDLPQVAAGMGYYDAALILLSRIASQETPQR